MGGWEVGVPCSRASRPWIWIPPPTSSLSIRATNCPELKKEEREILKYTHYWLHPGSYSMVWQLQDFLCRLYRVTAADFDYLKVIGTGSFGKVWVLHNFTTSPPKNVLLISRTSTYTLLPNQRSYWPGTRRVRTIMLWRFCRSTSFCREKK